MYSSSKTNLEAKIVILGSQVSIPKNVSFSTVDNCKVSLQIWDTAGQELKRNMTEDLVIVVVANKLDLALQQREVSIEEAQKYIARVLGPDTQLYEVSAKDDNGTIEDIFLHITRVLVDRKQYLPKKRQPTYLPMEEEPVASNSSCC
ncbi:hypothetical protein RO3G_15234 [Rhizopus delemar RA 99-880]|uniref:Uncharacterized protein n=1 Tax=Rhizopus delemar (strain RA 99-880 / ATCC MYA-4621 / FGSC 9543 / NRRL 43880) TaxID=246409 RepID=I1CPZ3_RHIO9|nr:hypothetical protein RO3G_15234 [Rhizopus delemar RA 99-880]|eukprot:EIE90523.1 hypothetical protein RO3G_15234 [Rhizopus delemar RA 99-880]